MRVRLHRCSGIAIVSLDRNHDCKTQDILPGIKPARWQARAIWPMSAKPLICDCLRMSTAAQCLSADEIALIRTTFTAAARKPDVTATLFYNKLFALDPSLRGLFHGDMRAQGEKLISMLELV